MTEPHPSPALGTTSSLPAEGPPLVTVLMAVYNVATYLREAIDSILNQSFSDFEFLIYNDGSTDDTAAIVRSYTDPRIFFFDSPINRSVSPNLNEGLARTRGRYIVRMDGDDIAYPERIARQVAYMEANPTVGLCGSAVRYIGASEAIIYMPENDDVIQHTMWLQNAFYQPSVIIRTSVLQKHNLCYNTDFEFAEDYKLWSDMSAITKLHNLPEVLLDYRIHPHQISRRKSTAQQKVSAKIRQEQMALLNIHLASEHYPAFDLLTIDDDWGKFQLADYKKVALLLDDFWCQAQKSGIATRAVYQVLSQQWARLLNAASSYRPTLLSFVLRSPFRRYISTEDILKLSIKCLIFWKPKAL